MKRRQLTGKQRKFLDEYLRNGQKGASAYRASYGGNPSPKQAGMEAMRLLKHPLIAPEVAAFRADREKKRVAALQRATDRYAISKERTAAELARIAYANSQDYLRLDENGLPVTDLSRLSRDEWAAVSEISVEDGRLKLKLHDKRGALMDLAKLMGHVVERRDINLSIKDMSSGDLLELLRRLEHEHAGLVIEHESLEPKDAGDRGDSG